MTNQKISWINLKNPVVATSLICLIIFSVNFVNYYFNAYYRNTIRKEVLFNAINTEGKITYIHPSSVARISSEGYAVYEFLANNNTCTGHTFHMYKGLVGDTIRLAYNKLKPSNNLYSADIRPETIRNNILPQAMEASGIFLIGIAIFSFVSYLWKLVKKKKELN